MKIMTVVGARPQFIKAAVLSRLFVDQDRIKETLIHTGQHYDAKMSDIFFQELELPAPDYNLQVGSASHGEQLGAMLRGLDEVVEKESPTHVLVYGDTTSTLAGALTALRHRIPLAHVEAGLRSFDRSMPEEHNRVATDHLSDWLFAPTPTAVENLNKEGVNGRICQVGDIMVDALVYYSNKNEGQPSEVLSELGLEGKPFALCTMHRAGNTDDEKRFRNLWSCVGVVAEKYPVVLPLHPRTRAVLDRYQITTNPNIHIVAPVGYREMLKLEKQASLILTDSGGVQKEAYLMGVPCITMRDNTEWVETVEVGWNHLVGDRADATLTALERLPSEGSTPRPQLYGEGKAGLEIIQELDRAA